MTHDAGRYRRYSDAVHELARPSLFDDRPCYRPTAIAWTGTRGQLRFDRTTYFTALDVCEALAHEHAEAWLANGQQPPSASQLPFRGAVRDPFDFLRRPMAMSINTLTMRRTESGTATVLLHKRNAAAVASAGGMYHVIPAGTFQPSSATQWVEDLDLWRNIMREMSEELLGRPEHDPDDTGGVDYTAEPYRSLDQARRAGRLRAVCLGIVVEPLTWWVEAQTVVVVDAHGFDDIFGTVAAHNEEGDLVAEDGPDQISVGIPFTADSMRRLARTPLAPVAFHLLQTAWLHRADLLSG
ncbi:MAG TPA: XRE family transcriptional regulator [Rugosimonospora sp.]|nr:XRE family transcriptional regulator [Rugosimonospora sp.]